jgi:hypothetical protein
MDRIELSDDIILVVVDVLTVLLFRCLLVSIQSSRDPSDNSEGRTRPTQTIYHLWTVVIVCPVLTTRIQLPLLPSLYFYRRNHRRRLMAPLHMTLGFRLSYHLRRPVPSLHCPHHSILRISHTLLFTRSFLHKIDMRRQIHGNSVDKGKHPASETRSNHAQPTSPSHSHGIFGGHSHSHGHDDHDHAHGGGLIETLEKGGARPRFYVQVLIHSIRLRPSSPLYFN